jgi:hypothetical protein
VLVLISKNNDIMDEMASCDCSLRAARAREMSFASSVFEGLIPVWRVYSSGESVILP